jgi:biotin carboxyl carrier protein
MSSEVTVPMAGKIVSIQVQPGDTVEVNDRIATLEAMKMEIPVLTQKSGTVKEIKVEAGQEVEPDGVIAVIE